MNKAEILKLLKDGLSVGLKDDKVQKMLFGTYSNGEARSLADAINNEMLSPEDRLLIEERMKEIREKRGKKGKKKKKHKKKKSYDWLDD